MDTLQTSVEPAPDPRETHERMVAANEALILGAMRQHELTEAAERLNAQLQLEIAARQKSARELAEKARLLDLSNDAIIVRGFDEKILSWNNGAEKLYGWASSEVLGLDLHELLQTEFPKPRKEIMAQLHREGHFIGEVVQRARDGRRVPSLCRWVLDLQTESILTSYTDITERKRVEEALRVSEERSRTLFDAAPMAVFVCDRDAVIQQFNERAVEIWGRAPVCGQEKHCGSLKLWLPDGTLLPHESSPMMEVLRNGIPARNVEVFIERPDGSRVPVLVNFAALRDAGGEITGTITSFMDITERHEMEAALLDRAADLARADRSKDEFLAMLAHELRNPLAPLRNAAEILQNAEASAEERTQAQRIIGRQIENMSRMIDDLLDISRITEGKIELRKEPVALEAILTAATSLVRSGCAVRHQDLAVSMPAYPIFLNADATRLEQVFTNLLGNACKYSGNGCHISLSAERAHGLEPPEVIVRVRDDGAGIDPELLPRVFDLFVQETRALDRAHGGLGIGLTLVNRLVKLHGGSVEAHSDGLGQGSEFVVHLPILRDAPPRPALPPRAAREKSRRILIVDDNTDSARSMALLQSRRGHVTRTAFTGPDAVTVAAEFLPEVMLLDIGRPGMDGFEVARRIRQMPALSGILLIAMTGYASPEDRIAAKDAGFDEHLVKPVDLEILREWLRPGATP